MLKKRMNTQLTHAIIIMSVIILDQWSKAWVVANIPIYGNPIWSWGGDFFQVIHVRNTGALFSLGNQWPIFFNVLLLKIIPTIILLYLAFLLITTPKIHTHLPKQIRWQFTTLQGIAFSFAVGGGFGNMIDRLFRPEGVVDFLDVKFYGIFGWERWPTFNIADMAVVLFMVLFVTHELVTSRKRENP